MIRSRDTPIRVAVVGSCATARIPRPNFVRLTNVSVAKARTSADPTMTSVMLVTVAPKMLKALAGLHQDDRLLRVGPPSETGWPVSVVAIPWVSCGRMKCTNSWSTNDAPIAVIRKTSDGALRFRSGR